MEHKAFVFDTETFHSAIEPVMRDSVANPEVARQYICEYYDGLQSPYTGEPLDEDGKTSLTNLTFRCILTLCSRPVMMWRMIWAWAVFGTL